MVLHRDEHPCTPRWRADGVIWRGLTPLLLWRGAKSFSELRTFSRILADLIQTPQNRTRFVGIYEGRISSQLYRQHSLRASKKGILERLKKGKCECWTGWRSKPSPVPEGRIRLSADWRARLSRRWSDVLRASSRSTSTAALPAFPTLLRHPQD